MLIHANLWIIPTFRKLLQVVTSLTDSPQNIDKNFLAAISSFDKIDMDLDLQVKTIFSELNKRFFVNKLSDVRLELSSRMKKCAGIYYPPKKSGDLSVIRLNKTMLSERSHSELMQTVAVSGNSF